MTTLHPRDSFQCFHIFRAELRQEVNTVHLHYSLDDKMQFEEVLSFPAQVQRAWSEIPETERNAFLDALSLVGGMSYYKAACPPEIVLEGVELSEQAAAFWTEVYRKGLGEFLAVNQLPFSRIAQVPATVGSIKKIAPTEKEICTEILCLVLLGGGKDSITSARLLQEAHLSFRFMTLGEHPIFLETAEVLDSEPPLTVLRQLSPRIHELNAGGYYNGHVPFSAYLAVVSTLLARLAGYTHVVASNEASAEEGNVLHDAVFVNHQYSKTLEFERSFQEYLGQEVSGSVSYFSLLRPFTEPEIVATFAEKAKAAFSVFSSCNRNFRLATSARPSSRWCGKCPKCAFTYMMLSPHLDESELRSIFGANLWEDEGLLPVFRELLGLAGHKPWECVGTAEECRNAVFAVVKKYNDTKIVPLPQILRQLDSELSTRPTIGCLPQAIEFQKVSRPHSIPEIILQRLQSGTCNESL